MTTSTSSPGSLVAAWRTRFSGWMRDPLIAPTVILVLALGFRLPALATRPIWYDEAFSVLFAAKGWSAMVQATTTFDPRAAGEVHPLLYYGLLSAWMQAFGEAAAVVRSLSVVLGLGMVSLGYAISRVLLTPSRAFWAGVLLACLPFQVHYAQETRMYALLGCLLLGATLAFVIGIRSVRWAPWVLLAVLAAAAQYTHNLAVVYLVPLAATSLAMRNRAVLLKTVASGLAAILLYLPWAGVLAQQLQRVQSGYWIEAPRLGTLVTTLLLFLGGLPVPQATLVVLLTAVVLVLTVGALLTIRAVRGRYPGWKVGLWLLCMAWAPVLLLFVISQFLPVYVDRALLPAGAMAALWLVWALDPAHGSRPLRLLGIAALVVSIVIGLWSLYTYRGFPYAPFAELSAYLSDRVQPPETVIHANKLSALPSKYIDREVDLRYLADRSGSASDTLGEETRRMLGVAAEPDIAAAVAGASGVWFVIFEREIDEYRSLGYDQHPAMEALTTNFTAVDSRAFNDLLVLHYVRKESARP